VQRVAAAVLAGLPAPALAASLAWCETVTTRAAGLRDLFGRRGHERIGRPGVSVHTDWTRRFDR
jgi:6-phosphogluconate dehydrogenase